MLALDKLTLLDISQLAESIIQTISFLKMVESKEVTTLEELGAAGNQLVNPIHSPTPNYCSDKLGDPRCWHLTSLHF